MNGRGRRGDASVCISCSRNRSIHTEHNRADVSFMYPYVDVGYSSGHKFDNVLPVVISTDVSVTNAAGMINDEADVQQTR